jgi:AcrR family transcriptional regulator
VAKREEILTAALEVVARHGYGRTSLRELAAAVGLSQAGVLHYFSSKEELFAEVLRKRDEVDSAAAFGTDPDARRADSDAFVRTIRHNADVPGLVQLYSRLSAEATDPDHPAHDFFAQRYRTFLELMAAHVRSQQAAGLLRPDLDPERVSRLLLALTDGMQTQWLLDPSVDMAEHVSEFLRLLRRPDGPTDGPTDAPAG